MHACSSALGPAWHHSTWAVHIGTLPVTCKVPNSWLCSSISSKRTAKLPDKRACSVYGDVIHCEFPPPNLNSIFICSVWGQIAKFKDCQYFRLYSTPCFLKMNPSIWLYWEMYLFPGVTKYFMGKSNYCTIQGQQQWYGWGERMVSLEFQSIRPYSPPAFVIALDNKVWRNFLWTFSWPLASKVVTRGLGLFHTIRTGDQPVKCGRGQRAVALSRVWINYSCETVVSGSLVSIASSDPTKCNNYR